MPRFVCITIGDNAINLVKEYTLDNIRVSIFHDESVPSSVELYKLQLQQLRLQSYDLITLPFSEETRMKLREHVDKTMEFTKQLYSDALIELSHYHLFSLYPVWQLKVDGEQQISEHSAHPVSFFLSYLIYWKAIAGMNGGVVPASDFLSGHIIRTITEHSSDEMYSAIAGAVSLETSSDWFRYGLAGWIEGREHPTINDMKTRYRIALAMAEWSASNWGLQTDKDDDVIGGSLYQLFDAMRKISPESVDGSLFGDLLFSHYLRSYRETMDKNQYWARRGFAVHSTCDFFYCPSPSHCILLTRSFMSRVNQVLGTDFLENPDPTYNSFAEFQKLESFWKQHCGRNANITQYTVDYPREETDLSLGNLFSS